VPAEPGPELAIEPLAGPVDATVELPGSKSITNRALVCAALADGTSTIRGALRADDTDAMLRGVEQLGASVEADGSADQLRITGNGGRLAQPPFELDARRSGTTARFLLPVLALSTGPAVLTGDRQLLRRPMGAGIDAVRQLGVTVDELGEPGHLPVEVRGPGTIGAARVAVAGSISSQFLSGLLLAGPAFGGQLTVDLTSDLVSRPYVEMTASVMRAFGAGVTTHYLKRFFWVEAGGYRATTYDVEPDASAASYFFAAAALCGGRVRVEGLGRTSTQGDLRFVEVLRRMGCEIAVEADHTEVRGGEPLRGIEVDLADLSDTAPTLAVVAAFAEGPTRVTGIGFIRRKETDRIAAIVTELRRCGIDAEEEADGFVVRPGGAQPSPARFETYDDHRMAMSFAVLGLRTPGTVILDPGCVAKTFPGFFETLDRLR
jgi:3-phosphoshikimate 1-carboxyvinyltransferase